MKIQVLWEEMLWCLLNTDILWKSTACFFDIQLPWLCNIHEDFNFVIMENMHFIRYSWNLFY